MRYIRNLILLLSLIIGLSACAKPPLITAAARGQTNEVKVLLEKGADINATDSLRWTPLMAAAFNGRIDTVKVLLSQGADVNLVSDEGTTALKLAKGRRHSKIVELLKAAGATK